MRRPSGNSAILSGICPLLAICVLALLFIPRSGQAQLISPGKLIEAHSDLEGINNCTQCHQLGERSANNALCLDCHTPIANRIEAGTGLHATTSDQNCATCHKDHFGVEFIPVRFDTLAFEHEETGFELTGAHVEASCRSCHQPEFITDADVIAFKGEHDALEKTFLGTADQCIGCHLPDTPHQEQFPEVNCDTCHGTEEWEEAPFFDHDEAEFVLTGKHVDVECASCHASVTSPAGETYVQYVDLEFASCASCHEDVHEGSFGANCESCHQTQGWFDVSNLVEDIFDHASTGFDLVGSHAGLSCASCHGKPARNDELIALQFTASTRQNTYPAIPVENCESCHVDYHDGVFVEDWSGGSCEQCHGEDAWYPSSFDFQIHNERSSFELTGAHIATPCSSCHQPDFDQKPHFEIAETACKDCHEEDNPHGQQFITDGVETICESCHVTDDWLTATLFDHDETDFPLTGLHETTECASCHVADATTGLPFDVVQYRETPTACLSCHEPDNPHGDQFEGQTCDSCHNTSSFYITAFDHDQTEFPLTGEHVEVSCISCHQNEAAPGDTPFIRFKPLGTACEDCHSDQ